MVFTKFLVAPLSPLPLNRLGLVDPEIQTLRAVTASFAGYHAVKRLAAELGFSAEPLTEQQIHLVHTCLLDAFALEVLELGLRCRAFSISQR